VRAVARVETLQRRAVIEQRVVEIEEDTAQHARSLTQMTPRGQHICSMVGADAAL
jgi:hypothetical protein